MRKNTERLAAIISLTLMGAVTAGHADSLTFDASGIISQADNLGYAPSAFANALAGNTLSVQFTVDTNALGAFNGVGDMLYANPLVSQSATVGAGQWSFGASLAQVEVMNNANLGGTFYSGYTLTNLANVPTDFTGVATSFALFTQASGPDPQALYSDASLSNAPLQSSAATDTDAMLLQFDNYVNGALTATADLFVGSGIAVTKQDSGHFAAPEMDPASLGSALTLLVGGAIVISSRRSKAV